MSRSEIIREKLTEAFHPEHLDVTNESSMHSVPPGSETHFKVLVVSAAFEGLGPVDRHRRVNDVLRDELRAGLHALSIRALTPEQFRAECSEFASPPCLGGSKADRTG